MERSSGEGREWLSRQKQNNTKITASPGMVAEAMVAAEAMVVAMAEAMVVAIVETVMVVEAVVVAIVEVMVEAMVWPW